MERVWCCVCIVFTTFYLVHSQSNNSVAYSYTRYRRQACGNFQFRCASGQCIDKTLVCDGRKNCNDGSDETDTQCGKTRCPKYAFQCSYGACIDRSLMCDRKEDCADGSDEQHPSCDRNPNTGACKSTEFQCKSGKCIGGTLVCDGIKDCRDDGSDETVEQCGKFKCSPFTFRCNYGACIDRDRLCDGRAHCADSSDEDPVRCGTGSTPSCKLPRKPEHGKYKIINCKDDDTSPLCRQVPDTIAPDWTILEYQCDEGYTMAGVTSIFCDGGKWANPHPTCVPVSCPPLQSNNLQIECSFERNNVSCENRMAPGTTASLKCRVSYQLTFEPGYNTIYCRQDGAWSNPLFTCTQECGKRNPEGKPFATYGEVAKVGEFPWHVGIYSFQNDTFTQICGGSLLNPDTVVTAAHCFWNEPYKRPFEKHMFRLAAGKYYRDWNIKDSEMQEREIKEIIIHDNYKGRPIHFSSDIAIVKLNVSVELTWAVLPVCIDWQNEHKRFQLVDGNLGSVVGWGITEKNDPSDELVTVNLPYIGFNNCYETIPVTFRPFLTPDKFCAGYLNGTSVCPGDSGGGLAFERHNKYYLRGIVSVGLLPEGDSKCYADQYTTFTDVSEFLPWMQMYVR